MHIETIMKLWRECGGRQHGPHVETVTLPLVDLPKFVEKIQQVEAVPDVTPDMLRAAQLNSELGGYVTSNWAGAYDVITELFVVMAKVKKSELQPEINRLKAENQRLREIIDVWDK